MTDTLRIDLFSVTDAEELPHGYVVLRTSTRHIVENSLLDQVVVLDDDVDDILPQRDAYFLRSTDLLESIEDGDVALNSGRGKLRVILTKRSSFNTLLVTERCDNRCLFCSQPPKEHDDSWLLVQAALAIATFDSQDTIGISGGEPLLYGDGFIQFLRILVELAPGTPLHILTNGRKFSDLEFTKSVALLCKSLNVTFGIPLYSAEAGKHDELVGAVGAFDQTIRGLINSGNIGLSVELRIIPTQLNMDELPYLVELVTRSFSGVSQISVMNLEPTGWAKHNWSKLYASPETYTESLNSAVLVASRARLPIILFNYPLCHIPLDLHRYAVMSISDWKNYYPDECGQCALRSTCGGYFVSSKGAYHQPPRRYQ